MSNRPRAEFLTFQQTHGRHLIEYGSAEYGVNITDARALLELLATKGVPVLGIEIWREVNGHYRLKGQETLVPVPGDAAVAHLDALQYLANINAGQNDVFGIQFG